MVEKLILLERKCNDSRSPHIAQVKIKNKEKNLLLIGLFYNK